MRKFLYGTFFALFAVAIVAAVVFGVIYFQQKQTVDDQTSEISSLKSQVSDLQSQTNASSTLTFEDKGLGVSFQYPASWEFSSNTPVDYDQVEDSPAPIVATYDATFTKDNASINFQTILGSGVGFIMGGHKNTTHEYVSVDETKKLVRTRELDKDDWSYVELVDCTDDAEDILGFEPDFCIMPVFPDEKKRPTIVSAEGLATQELLADADVIAKSAL